MSSGRSLHIHTHVALSCDLLTDWIFFTAFKTPLSIWCVPLMSIPEFVKTDLNLLNYWKREHLLRQLSNIHNWGVPICLLLSPFPSSSPALTTAHTFTALKPTAVQQYTHSQPTDSKLLLSFPTTPCLRSQPPAKQNWAGNFTTNYPVSAKSPQEQRKSKPWVSLPPQQQSWASFAQKMSSLYLSCENCDICDLTHSLNQSLDWVLNELSCGFKNYCKDFNTKRVEVEIESNGKLLVYFFKHHFYEQPRLQSGFEVSMILWTWDDIPSEKEWKLRPVSLQGEIKGIGTYFSSE